MPRALFRLFAWMAILVFAVGAKLHLPIVQTTGWIGMTAAYATIMPLDEAVAHATSGRELCVVCEYVRSAEHLKQAGEAIIIKTMAQSDSPPMGGDTGIEITAPTGIELPSNGERTPNRFAAVRTERPETPPPRAA